MKCRIAKVAALLLALVLVMVLFAGCQSEKEQSPADAEKPSGGGNESSESEKGSSGPESLTLPIVTEPLTLTFFTYLDGKVSASLPSMNEVACYKEMEKKTGIHVEFQHPVGQSDIERLSAMIASQELPDIIRVNWSNVPGGPGKAISDGTIIRLNDLIDQYAPNLTKVFEEIPEASKQAMLDDGTRYMFPMIAEDKEMGINWGLQMRKDWLDNLNLQVPGSMNEWYTVLKAFKDGDPNGNGRPDELPLVSNGAGVIQAFESAWGITHDFYIREQDGKIGYGPVEPAYRDFLVTMNKWYEEGLIDPDYASTNNQSFNAKITSNLAGAFGGYVSGNMQTYLIQMASKDANFDLIGVPWPKGSSGKSYNVKAGTSLLNGGAAISGKSEHPIEATKWLDYHYSEEGHMLVNFGIEGESYIMENGYPKYTDLITNNPDGLSFGQALARYAISPYTGPMVQDKRYFEQQLTLPQMKDAVKAWAAADNVSMLLPPITPTDQESAQIASIIGDIKTYVTDMFNKFIMGQEPIENFDNYISTLKSMGIEEVVKIQQTALDRYNARAK